MQPTTSTGDDVRSHKAGYDAELDKLKTGSRWQRLRLLVIKRDPLCRRCDLSVSEIADHIVPAQEAVSQARLSGAYPFDRFAGYFLMSNLQGLCRSCHWTKTAEDKTHVGPWPDVVAKEREAPKRRWSF